MARVSLGELALSPPELTNEYPEALRQHGMRAEVTIAPGLLHDMVPREFRASFVKP